MKKTLTLLVIAVLLFAITLTSCSNNTPEVAVAYIDYADGSESTDTLIIKNGKVTLPRSPQRDGYDFDGWIVDGTVYKYPLSVSVQNGTKITAKWTKLCTVTVKYYIDGVADSREKVRSGEDYTLPGSPKKVNSVFGGWNIDGKTYAPSAAVAVTNDIIAEAKWGSGTDSTITIDYGITGVQPVKTTVDAGDFFTVPVSPEWKGHTFEGWLVDGKTYFHPDYVAVEDGMTVTAKWTDLHTVTVVYGTDYSHSTVKQTVEDGEYMTLPVSPQRDGYEFDGWDVGESELHKYPYSIKITENRTITAKWTKLYTVTVKYGIEGLSDTTEYVRDGDTYTLPTVPAKTGSTCDGWKVGSETGSEKKSVGETITVTGNTTVTASWTDKTIHNVTYSIGEEGGSYYSFTVCVYDGDTMEYLEKAYEREGCTIVWTHDGKSFDIKTKITQDYTTAITGTYTPIQFTVKFDSGEGGSAVDDETVNYGEAVTKPDNPTKTGYTFKGWTLSGSDYLFDTPVMSDITLTAVWEINSYKVTFDSKGGGDITSQSVKYQGCATEPADPTKEGATFQYWMLNGTKFEFSTPVTEDITLEAKWNITTYTVTFDINMSGASEPSTQTIEYGRKIYVPQVGIYNGKAMTGWFDESGNRFDLNTSVTANYKLKAEWGDACTVTIRRYTTDEILKTEVVGKGTLYSVEKALGYKVTRCTDEDWKDHSSEFTVENNITLYISKGDYLTYSVGDNGPAGGRIFCVNTSGTGGWRYLEAAPEDLDKPYSILGNATRLTGYSYDGYSDLGFGKSNTSALSGGNYSGGAAEAFLHYSWGGYDDWFIPCYAEMLEMFRNSGYVSNLSGEHLTSTIVVPYSSSSVFSVSDGAVSAVISLTTQAKVRPARMF